jgi:hypothetical protein
VPPRHRITFLPPAQSTNAIKIVIRFMLYLLLSGTVTDPAAPLARCCTTTRTVPALPVAGAPVLRATTSTSTSLLPARKVGEAAAGFDGGDLERGRRILPPRHHGDGCQ